MKVVDNCCLYKPFLNRFLSVVPCLAILSLIFQLKRRSVSVIFSLIFQLSTFNEVYSLLNVLFLILSGGI